MRRDSAKAFVLDLLRVAPEDEVSSARGIVAIGEMLGFKPGAVRAALSRLVRAGRLVQDERAAYRLAPANRGLSAFVESWREGERRRTDWDGAWCVVSTPAAPDRTALRHSERALSLVGFARAEPRLWTRPRNLARSRDELERLLVDLGLMDGAELFVASELSEAMDTSWRELWPLANLRRNYVRASKAIETSLARLDRLPPRRLVSETFERGGAAIRVLATDPLLPEEIQPSDERERLFELMTTYDRVGREIWREALSGLVPQ